VAGIAVAGVLGIWTVAWLCSLLPGYRTMLEAQGEVAGWRTPAELVRAGFFLAATPAFFEELFFRGYLLDRLGRHWGPRAALLAQAALFAPLHGPAERYPDGGTRYDPFRGEGSGRLQVGFGRFQANHEGAARAVRPVSLGDVRQAVQEALPAGKLPFAGCDDPRQVLVPHLQAARNPVNAGREQLVDLRRVAGRCGVRRA
jgi:hypothetical protein